MDPAPQNTRDTARQQTSYCTRALYTTMWYSLRRYASTYWRSGRFVRCQLQRQPASAVGHPEWPTAGAAKMSTTAVAYPVRWQRARAWRRPGHSLLTDDAGSRCRVALIARALCVGLWRRAVCRLGSAPSAITADVSAESLRLICQESVQWSSSSRWRTGGTRPHFLGVRSLRTACGLVSRPDSIIHVRPLCRAGNENHTPQLSLWVACSCVHGWSSGRRPWRHAALQLTIRSPS